MTLVTGRAGAGKTAFILDRFREAASARLADFRLIVPTATMAQHLRNRLARESFVFRPDRIATLAHFVQTIEPQARTAPPATFQLMVEDAVRAKARPEFAKVAETPGFLAALARTMEEFDGAGCDAARLARDLPSAEVAAAFVDIWSAVERDLKRRGFTTRGKLFADAARTIAGTRSDPVGHIWMDGFSAFSDPELEVIRALANASEIVVTLPASPACDVPRSRLLSIGFVERPLPAPEAASARTVHFVAENIEREVDEIARRILLAVDRGCAFRDIGVVLRNPAAYAPLLRATLERFGIPARFYFGEMLGRHAVAAYFENVVEALLSGWEHERTLAALRLSPGFGQSSEMDSLDFHIRGQLPGRGLQSFLEFARHRVLDRFAELNPWTRQRVAPAEWAERFRKLVSGYGAERPRDAVRPQEIEIYRKQAAALQQCVAAIAEAAEWFAGSDRPIALADFWRILKSVLRVSTLDSDDQRRNVVHVMSAYEARQWDLQDVFICGLVEKQFPKTHAQNPFFPDSAIRDLQQRGIRLRTSAERDREETWLYDFAAARAKLSLTLSYPAADARGEQNLPSIFLAGLETIEPPCPLVKPAPRVHPDSYKPPSAVRSADLLRVLEQKHVKVNVSSLESYLQCPFQFFARTVLRLEGAPDRPQDRLNFLLQGSIVHDVLARWYAERPPILPLLEKVFREHCERSRVPSGYNTEMIRQRLCRDLESFEKDNTWPSRYEAMTEQKFEMEVTPSLRVSGRIDRIDRLPDGSAIVVDYKYSNRQNTRSKTTDDTKLQGPLYVRAVEEKLGCRVSAMVYFSLREKCYAYGWGEVEGLKLDPLKPEWKESGLARTIEVMDRFRTGRIAPEPATIEPCRYCDFRDLCRYTATQVRAATVPQALVPAEPRLISARVPGRKTRL